ncbi:MAG: hypothetical protein H8E66_28860 [Planctomycetes bacterium]|nr:hypothetical protein [Planctomycetota bacterium]
MLIPRFSLRQLLAITTVSSLFCYIIAMATRGHQWAIAITLAISSLLLTLVIHAIIFSVAWLLTLFGGSFSKQRVAVSPFANATPPPQLVTPPEDNE